MLNVDFVANAASLGTDAVRANTLEDLKSALLKARNNSRTTVVVIEVDPDICVPVYESWWDVQVVEISESKTVQAVRKDYDTAVKRERHFW